MNNWCVIYTHQGKELYSVSELNKQNFNTYMPSIMKIVRHSRYIKKVLKPFFPRYIFVNLHLDNQEWRKINYTRGVVKLITSNEKPIMISESVIKELKLLENDKGFIDEAFVSSYKQGEKLEITNGPLKGIAGIFDGLSEDLRIKVLLNFMGKTMNIPIHNDWVTRA